MTKNINVRSNDFNGLKAHEVINKVASDIMQIKQKNLNESMNRESIRITYNKLNDYKQVMPIQKIIDVKTSLYGSNDELFKKWDECLYNIRYILDSHMKGLEKAFFQK